VNARAGVVTSQVAWLASLPVTAAAPTLELSLKGAVAGFLVAALASFMPDLDHHNSTAGRYMPDWVRPLLGGHRMLTHSLLSIIFAWWLTGYLIGNPIVANAVAIGWATHVAIDMLTLQGVGLLYPLTRRKFGLGWIRTGSTAEDRFVTGMKLLGFGVAILYGYLLIPGGPEWPLTHHPLFA
jgi:inner membrane protein